MWLVKRCEGFFPHSNPQSGTDFEPILNLDNFNFENPSTTTSDRQYGTSEHRREEAKEEVVCNWQ
jgi:hypothetical protein